MTIVQNKKIVTFVLDWTLKQPIELQIPKGAVILKILYINKYDHLFVLADISAPKETRKFAVKKTNDVIEEIEQFNYITSTHDEDDVAWHIFEIVKKCDITVSNKRTQKKDKNEQQMHNR